MDCSGAELLAEHVGSGVRNSFSKQTCVKIVVQQRLNSKALSMRASAAIAAAFVRDGARGKANKQLSSSGRERDFWRWMALPFRPYRAQIPLVSTGRPGQPGQKVLVMEEVNFVLPSDVFHQVQLRGLENELFLGLSSLEEWWHSPVSCFWD